MPGSINRDKQNLECEQWPHCYCTCEGCKSRRTADHCQDHSNDCHVSCEN